MSSTQRVSVIGLGKLGMPIAACFAEKGFDVLGVDLDPGTVEGFNRCEPRFFEPGLRELLLKNRDRIHGTDDFAEAVRGTQMSFILVPTPSLETGEFSLEYVVDAGRRLGAALMEKEDYHVVVLTSTVMPGATDETLKPLLEKESKKRCGDGFGLCYSPEFVALGSVIYDVFNPELTLIGESDPRAGRFLEQFYGRVCDSEPGIARMNFVNAELTKLAVNTFVTTRITFANTLARLCERIPSGSVDDVTRALGMDSRIGSRYLKGAIGYGGPCFPRDNLAFSRFAERLGVSGQLAEATDKVNRGQVAHLAEFIISRLPEDGTVGILGLSYKPNTGVVEEAQGLLLARQLAGSAIRVLAYDPAGVEAARAELADSVEFTVSPEECASGSDVVVITTPWEEFRGIDPAVFARKGSRRVVIDCWRLLEKADFEQVCDYIELGVGRNPDS